MKVNLIAAKFIKRYKRFLVDVELDGQVVTVHCPNTGSMLGCFANEGTVFISASDSKTRKYPHTLEVTKVNGHLIGVNTHNANKLVHEAIISGVIEFTHPVTDIKPEIKLTTSSSRLDFLVQAKEQKTYVEVKNTTLCEDGVAKFPDSVTVRGQKHLDELIQLQQTHKAMLVFCVQHTGALVFKPSSIDPVYAKKLALCKKAGVDIKAFVATIDNNSITLTKQIPVQI